jgi:hypothetical protein
MTKAFIKGQLVTFISRWSDAEFKWCQATVYSCGKVRMILTVDSTGEELGHNFKAVRGEGWAHQHTFERMTGAAAEAKALELSASYVDYERALSVTRGTTQWPDGARRKAEIAALSVSAIEHSVAHKRITDAIAKRAQA